MPTESDRQKVIKTTCKKCAWAKNNFCPYLRYLSDDLTHCEQAEYYKTPYWRKKDKENEESIRLGKLITNGITPKYKLGDEVWHIYHLVSFHNVPEKFIIRKILANKDGTEYRYQVKGHTEYTYSEEDLYETEEACLKAIFQDFINRTVLTLNGYKKDFNRLGLDIKEPLKQLTDGSKD